jgi:hypothetical protein
MRAPACCISVIQPADLLFQTRSNNEGFPSWHGAVNEAAHCHRALDVVLQDMGSMRPQISSCRQGAIVPMLTFTGGKIAVRLEMKTVENTNPTTYHGQDDQAQRLHIVKVCMPEAPDNHKQCVAGGASIPGMSTTACAGTTAPCLVAAAAAGAAAAAAAESADVNKTSDCGQLELRDRFHSAASCCPGVMWQAGTVNSLLA